MVEESLSKTVGDLRAETRMGKRKQLVKTYGKNIKKKDEKSPWDRIKLVWQRISKEASVAEASRREGIRDTVGEVDSHTIELEYLF